MMNWQTPITAPAEPHLASGILALSGWCQGCSRTRLAIVLIHFAGRASVAEQQASIPATSLGRTRLQSGARSAWNLGHRLLCVPSVKQTSIRGGAQVRRATGEAATPLSDLVSEPSGERHSDTPRQEHLCHHNLATRQASRQQVTAPRLPQLTNEPPDGIITRLWTELTSILDRLFPLHCGIDVMLKACSVRLKHQGMTG